MKEPADFYETLQVHPSADLDIIQAAYRRLVLRYHPDRNPLPEAIDIIQRVNQAFEVLSDPDRRAEYDRSLAARNEPAIPPYPAADSEASTEPGFVRWPGSRGPDQSAPKRSFRWSYVVILSAGLVAALSVWAGFRVAAQSTAAQTPLPADAPAAVAREPVVFSYLNWDSAQLQTRIVMRIVEHGYGYPVDTVVGDATSIFSALIDGRPQVSMEVWLPSEDFEAAVAAGKLLSLGKSLDDNWQSGFVIPSYVARQYPGLRSVHDLPEFKHVFADSASNSGKARLMSCVTGWVCGEVNQQKLKAYGLEDSVQILKPGSDSELFNSLEDAYARRAPWLGYMWSPTRTALNLDLTALEEPPYSVQCWETDKKCAYPTAQIVIGVHPSLPKRAPEVVEFLKNWDLDAESQLAAETWMEKNDGTIDEAAVWFLSTNEDWRQWAPHEVVSRVLRSLGGRVAGSSR